MSSPSAPLSASITRIRKSIFSSSSMDLPNRRKALAFSSMVIDLMSSSLSMGSVSATRALTLPLSDVLVGLSGQFRDKWPCLLQVKQRPSLRCVSGSSLVELTCYVLVERSARLELDGYDSVVWHVVLEACASSTL